MKRLILEIGIACGILVILYIALFLPFQNAYRDRAGMVHEKNKDLEKNLPVVMRSSQVEKEFRSLSSELDRLKSRMSKDVDRAEVATLLRNSADRLDLVVKNEGAWSTFTEKSKDDNLLWAGLFRRYRKSMTLEGEFFSIGRFLETVEEIDDFARNTQIVMKKTGDGSSDLEVELTVDLYDLHELSLK